GLAHVRVDRVGAVGQQAVNVLALVEAAGKVLVVFGQENARLRGPGGVIHLPAAVARLRGPGSGHGQRKASLSSPGIRVSTSTPSAVTATMCSHCAESLRSF